MNLGLNSNTIWLYVKGLLPADFELNHLAKWVLSVGKKAFWIILMERWDLRVAFLLMRSCFAWLVIKPSNLPIIRLEMFHLWSQMDFFFRLTQAVFVPFILISPSSSLLSLSLSLYYYCGRSEFACDRVPSAFHPCIFRTKYNYILNYKPDIFATYKDT